MRYDCPIYFQKKINKTYNPNTGNYEYGALEEELIYASVNDTGTETINLIYGQVRLGVKTVQIQNGYDKPFQSIRIGSKVYRVDFQRRLRTKQTFVVSEV